MQQAHLIESVLTPKWLIKQGGVAFGFGGKIARFTSKYPDQIDVIPFTAET